MTSAAVKEEPKADPSPTLLPVPEILAQLAHLQSLLQSHGVAVPGAAPPPIIKSDTSAPQTADPTTAAPPGEADPTTAAPPAPATLLPQCPQKKATKELDLPPGIDMPALSPEERAAAWAKYQRSCNKGASKSFIDPSDQRAKRSDKVPEHIATQMAGFHEKQYYFKLWLACDGWKGVAAFEEHFFEHLQMEEEKEAWLTDAQMMQIFHDRVVVDEMKGWAMVQTDKVRVRAHPKIPHCEEARQYKCQISSEELTRTSDVVKKGIRMQFDLEGEAGKSVVRQRLTRDQSVFKSQGTDDTSAVQIDESDASFATVQGRKRPADRFLEDETPEEKKTNHCGEVRS